MRFYNNKYKKICATCKKMNSKDSEGIYTCPLKEIIKELEEKNITEEEFQNYVFANSCEEHENFFFEEKNVKEVIFDDFEYNLQKNNMSQKVRICNPYDSERKTYLGFNLGFLPAFPEMDASEENKLYIQTGFDLAFYLPELNIVVFSSEAIWYPLAEDELEIKQISEAEALYFEQNKENIIEIFFPNLFKEEKERELEKCSLVS